jgi:hypothetical protein
MPRHGAFGCTQLINMSAWVQAVNAVCLPLEELSQEGCLETLYAALALAHGSDVDDVKRQLALASNGDGQTSRRNDAVRWVSAIWAGGPQAAAGTAAACLQSMEWEAVVPHLSGALLCSACVCRVLLSAQQEQQFGLGSK